jgi:RNA-directed DNA polymerase
MGRIREINRFAGRLDGVLRLRRHALAGRGLDKWLRRRLRQVRWKEWKRPQTRDRNLRALGIPERDAPQLGGLAEGLLAHRRLRAAPDRLPNA